MVKVKSTHKEHKIFNPHQSADVYTPSSYISSFSTAYFLLPWKYRKPLNICLLWYRFILSSHFSLYMYPNSNQTLYSLFPGHYHCYTWTQLISSIWNKFPTTLYNMWCMKRKENSGILAIRMAYFKIYRRSLRKTILE